jgi:hypothetical protein
MLLCPSNDAHDAVEPLDPPADAKIGERCWFGNEQLQVRLNGWILCFRSSYFSFRVWLVSGYRKCSMVLACCWVRATVRMLLLSLL